MTDLGKEADPRVRLRKFFPLWGHVMWPWLTLFVSILVLLGFLGTSPSEAVRTLIAPASEGIYYQRLAEAFLDGRAYLTEEPPAWLLAAPNPYNPDVSAPVRAYGIHDAILFEGRYWYYWSPGVVAFLVAPLRGIGILLGELQVGFAALVAIAACGIDAARIVQWSRGASRSFSILLSLAMGLPFTALFLIPRIAIWESNVLAAGALAAIALQCFIRFWIATPGSSQRTLIFGSLAAALATTVRPEAAIVFLVPIVQFVISRITSGRLPLMKPQGFALVTVSLLVGVGFVLGYNAWRFGNLFDFKVEYMLTGAADQSKLVFSSTEYLLPNSYYYLVRPIGLSPSFPMLDFEAFKWPFERPLDFADFEPAVGAFWVMPWAFLGLVPLLAVLLISRVRPSVRDLVDARFGGLSVLLLTSFTGLVVFLSVNIFSPTERYHLLPAILLGLAGMSAIAAVPSLFVKTAKARIFRGLITFLFAWSIFVALIGGSQGYYPPGTEGGPIKQSLAGRVVTSFFEELAQLSK